MLTNYLKIAVRNLFKNKVYSVINIFGLAIGIACCMLISLYVYHEWSYDGFHQKADRTYRVWYEETLPDQRVISNTATPVILSPTMQDNIPEIEEITYLFNFNNLVSTDYQSDPQDEAILVVRDDFFRIFDFKLLQGTESTVFSDPSSLVLSESAARRLFGNRDPMQERLSVRMGEAYQEFSVGGVIQDPPSNSSLAYNILMPYENIKNLISERGRQSWFNVFGNTVLTLRKGTDPQQLNASFEAMMKSVLGEEIYNETQYTIHLQPLTDIHLNTELGGGLFTVSDPAYSYILSAIALLILIIAGINFMTLSISRSTARAKEVGVRKTIGAMRQHLMLQFWGEALLMTLISFSIGLTFAEIFLPFFNDLSGTNLDLEYNLFLLGGLLITAFIVSLFAGIYPALILSGFQPMEVLKGRITMSSQRGRFQKIMVVFQFSLSIALIIGTLTIRQQMNFIQQKNLGYQKEQIMVFETGLNNTPQNDPDDVFQNAYRYKQLLENDLGADPDIANISTSSFTPVQAGGWFQMGFTDDQGQIRNFHGNIVDADFLPLMDIRIKEGRNFSEDIQSDQRRAIIVNEALVKYFGWENPIGQRIPGPEFDDHEVVGVVENFHFESLHTPVEPLAMAMSFETLFSGIQNLGISSSFNPRISVSLTTPNLQRTISSLRESFRSIAPGTPFDYTFVDQALDQQYREELRLSRIVTTGAFLAIIIACLGLFGLASLMVVRRTKEIGVRKVLGASSSHVILLVNREFTKLVGLAFLIAAPLAWFGMKEWLEDFAYRIEPGLSIFIIAGGITLAVAWFTVSYQSIKATLVNPVDSLKSE